MDNSSGSMGVALHAGLYYHIDSQLSLGLYVLAPDPIIGSDLRTASQVTFSTAINNTRLLSLNGRYAFNKNERDHFFFTGLGLGLKRNWSYIRVNNVERISNTGIPLIPEIGYQWVGIQIALTFTTPVASPTFDQVGNDDGVRYVMERGFLSTLQYSIRYQFKLFSRD